MVGMDVGPTLCTTLGWWAGAVPCGCKRAPCIPSASAHHHEELPVVQQAPMEISLLPIVEVLDPVVKVVAQAPVLFK
jgi:hypothetical protein